MTVSASSIYHSPTRRSLCLTATAIAGTAALGGCSGGAESVAEAAAVLRRPLDLAATDPIPELVRFATLAANSHNTQPWRFQRAGAALRIGPDLERRTPAVDPDDHHLFASLGCAAENLMTAASAYGLGAAYLFDPQGKAISVDLVPAGARASALLDAIPKRQCTRSVFSGRSVTHPQ